MSHDDRVDRLRRCRRVSRREFLVFSSAAFVSTGAAYAIAGCGSGDPFPDTAEDDFGPLSAAGDAAYPVRGPYRYIDEDLCLGCGQCVPLCPMGAISLVEGKSHIDPSECAECNVCFRSGVCPRDAITPVELEWPRVIRAVFSDPLAEHEITGVRGRGTEGMKTNDSLERFQSGELGVFVELGRPALGARFYDVEKALKRFKAHGYEMVEENPIHSLITDPDTGSLDPEILNEKVISSVFEFTLPQSATGELMEIVQQLAGEVDTVFNVCVALRADHKGESPIDRLFPSDAFRLPNGKVNIGMAQGIAAERGTA